MSDQRIGFGAFEPDKPQLINGKESSRALNVIPKAYGYGPMPSQQVQDFGSGATGPSEKPRGAIHGVDDAGNPYNFVGGQTKIEGIRDSALFQNYTRETAPGSGVDVPYTLDGSGRWEFVQVGQNVIAVSRGEETQVFDLSTAVATSRFVAIGNDAPRAATCAQIDQHLFLGQINDRRDGPNPLGVAWPAIGNPYSWPEPGSDIAVAVQSGRQTMPGAGGYVVGIVGGIDVGLILQERRLSRVDYIGGDVMFDINTIEDERGLLIPGLAVPFGRQVLFYAEDGFFVTDFITSSPIGKERVDTYFQGRLDFGFLDRVSATRDPDHTGIYITYASTSSPVAGEPDSILHYDWALNRWTEGDEAIELFARSLPPGDHLDSPPPEDIDADNPTESYDERQSQVGDTKLASYAPLSGGVYPLSSLEGSPLAAEIHTAVIEVTPGLRSRIRRVRPLVSGGAAKISVTSVDDANKASSIANFRPDPEQYVAQEVDGSCPVLVEGRYHIVRTSIPAGGFVDAIGVELEYSKCGRR